MTNLISLNFTRVFCLIFASLVCISCSSISTQQQLLQQQIEIEKLKNETEGYTNNSSERSLLKSPQTPVPAPVPTSINKFGPGNGNNMGGSVEGYVTVRTNSAGGKLTLRANPDQNASSILEIPTGTSDVFYFNKLQIGDYVWYNVQYGDYSGFLRGDYLDRNY